MALSVAELRAVIAAPRLPLPDDTEGVTEALDVQAAAVQTLAVHAEEVRRRRERRGADAGEPMHDGNGFVPAGGDKSHGERWYMSTSADSLARVTASLHYLTYRLGVNLGFGRDASGVWRIPLLLSGDRDGPLAALRGELKKVLAGGRAAERIRLTAMVGFLNEASSTISVRRPSGARDWGVLSALHVVRVFPEGAKFDRGESMAVRPGRCVVVSEVDGLRLQGPGLWCGILFDDDAGAEMEPANAEALRLAADAADKTATSAAVNPSDYGSFELAAVAPAEPAAPAALRA
eukprot:gene9579-4426_t